MRFLTLIKSNEKHEDWSTPTRAHASDSGNWGASGTGRVLADAAGLQSEPSAPVVTGVSIQVRRARRRVERKQS